MGWQDDARAHGWPEETIHALENAYSVIGAEPKFVHADVIVAKNQAGANFTTVRETTERGIAAANHAMNDWMDRN